MNNPRITEEFVKVDPSDDPSFKFLSEKQRGCEYVLLRVPKDIDMSSFPKYLSIESNHICDKKFETKAKGGDILKYVVREEDDSDIVNDFSNMRALTFDHNTSGLVLGPEAEKILNIELDVSDENTLLNYCRVGMEVDAFPPCKDISKQVEMPGMVSVQKKKKNTPE